jgi:hypothetical protein
MTQIPLNCTLYSFDRVYPYTTTNQGSNVGELRRQPFREAVQAKEEEKPQVSGTA